MKNSLINIIFICFLFLLTCSTTVSYGINDKPAIELKVKSLANTPSGSLTDSINDIVFNLYQFEYSYGVQILEQADSLLPADAVEARTIAKHYLYEFDKEHRYERLEAALKYAQSHGYDKYYLDYLITKGNLYYFDQALDSAMYTILEARDIVDQKDFENEVEINHLLGDIFFALELYDNAEEYYNKANSLIQNPGKYSEWRGRVINNNLGLIKIEKGDYQGAIEAFKDPINESAFSPQTFNDSLLSCYLNRKTSYCLIQLETKLDSALELTRFSLAFSKIHHLDEHLIPSYLNIVRLFIKQGQPDSVKHYFSEYTNSVDIESLPYDYQLEDLLLKSETSEYLGNIEDPLEYQKQYSALHISMHLNKQAAAIIKMLTDQDYGKLESNFKQVNNQRRYLIIAIIIASVLAIVILKYALETSQLNKKLVKSNSTKDKLFSIISHDLRSPFHSIIGFNEIIAESLKRKEYDDIETYNKIVVDSSNGLIKMIDNLLLWSKSQQNNLKLDPSSVNIKDLIDEAVSVSELQAKKKSISFNTEDVSDFTCHIDKPTVSIVLNNLISNALKFSYTDSQITLKTTPRGNYIDISIADSGVGMPKEKLDDLFEITKSKSTQGTENENGTGLGLVICKEFIEKNKGTITVESTLKVGTTFTITLPKT